jgi:2-polyprenyl-6-hydroxyphenyl methylase / 3-demethylubiquinone-9 3-methyltransferase
MAMGRQLAEEIYGNEADPAFRRRALWIGEMIAAHQPQSTRQVLDIGCGRGFYFPLYGALKVSFTGVEIDPVPLAMARQIAAKFGGCVLDTAAETLPFENDTFDIVVMSEVLEHMENPQIALLEAKRVLKSSGILLVTVPNANFPFLWDPINAILGKVFNRPIRRGPLAGIWANHVRLYSPSQIQQAVANANFLVQDVFTHTSKCLPFHHNIVYGLGKPLLESSLMPATWIETAARGTGRKHRFNPVGFAIALIQFVDRFNPDRARQGEKAQNICLLAKNDN